MAQPVTVGVAQFSAVNFNLEATLDKLEEIVKDAASKGVQLLVFPEAFLPGYPHGGDLSAAFGRIAPGGRTVYKLWFDSAVLIPGPAITRLSEIAKENRIFLVVGLIEKEAPSGSTLYCTVVFVKEDGTFLGKHRKLMPTNVERTIWGRGDGSTLPVFDTPMGRVGAVICWENYMPLLKATMYSKGIQIYCAPTIDGSDNWEHTMRHIAVEGRCFVLGCNQFTKRSDYPPDSVFPNVVSDTEGDTVLARGGSIIISPSGEVLAGPNYTSEELLVAQIDLGDAVAAKYDLDAMGHFNRPDVFTLYVNEKPARDVVTLCGIPQKLEMTEGEQTPIE